MEKICARPDHLPSFIFRIMIPWYLLIFQNFWNFNKASQVYTLSVSDDNFLLLNTCIAYIICIVANVLLWHPECAPWRSEDRGKRMKGRKVLLNITPINYVVTSTNTSDRRISRDARAGERRSPASLHSNTHTRGDGEFLWFMAFKIVRVHFRRQHFPETFLQLERWEEKFRSDSRSKKVCWTSGMLHEMKFTY